MGLIDHRNGDLGIIEGRFIKHVLDDQAGEILKDSKRGMKGFKSAKWNKNKMQVDSNTLTYDTIAATRFVDMKTRRSKGYQRGSRKVPGGKRKKKNYFKELRESVMQILFYCFGKLGVQFFNAGFDFIVGFFRHLHIVIRDVLIEIRRVYSGSFGNFILFQKTQFCQ